MMRSGLVLAVALGLVLLACTSVVDQTPIPTAAATGLPPATLTAAPTVAATTSPTSPTSTAAPAPACDGVDPAGALVAYWDADDLWLYDVVEQASRRLTNDGPARSEHAPAFLGGTCIVYARGNPAAIELRELSDKRAARVIVEEAGWITSLDIRPVDGSIVYLHVDYDVDGAFRLKRVGIDGGAPVILHTFDAALGRGAGSEDEVSVAWSPDGSTILVANTHAYTDSEPFGAIHLFDQSGRQVGERWTGTHPRWSPDGRTIYYRGHAGVNGQRWYELDVRSMTSTMLGIRPGTNGAVVSPDGRRLAYDTSYFGDLPSGLNVSGKAPDVYVYDLKTGKETLLRRGALAPLWISATELIVTNAGEPTGPSLNSWETLGTITKVSIGGKRTTISVASTMFDSAVYFPR